MKTFKTTFLSFGASLLASVLTLSIYIDELKTYQQIFLYVFTAIGIICLSMGTGFLLENIVNPILRKWRQHFPAIAIINDLPWSSSKGTYAWVDTTSTQWKENLNREAAQKNIKANIVLTSINRLWQRIIIERYNVIINPYGPVYPEINIKEFPVWNALSSYTINGGTIISVADIPFYYAYDVTKEVRYNLNKNNSYFIAKEYKVAGKSMRLSDGTLIDISPFSGTPFLEETRTSVVNIEHLGINTATIKVEAPDKPIEIKDIKIHRAFRLDKKNSSKTFIEININDELFSPLSIIDYGKGHFIVSLLFLDNVQNDNVKMQISDLMVKLTLKELRIRTRAN
jgi:hypothetical protein